MLETFEPGISLKERVYETLKAEILTGSLKAGQQLNITDLSARMGISGAPVREALGMLQQNGLVVLTPRKKALVAEFSNTDRTVIIELRQMLEPYAAKLCTGKIPQQVLADVREQLLNVLNDPHDFSAYIESDKALHRIMSTYCDSQILRDLLKTVKDHSIRFRYSTEESITEEDKTLFIEMVTKEHLDILAAWEEENADEVYHQVALHLKNYLERSNGEGILEQFLEKQRMLF